MALNEPFSALEATFRVAVPALLDARLPFALGGSLAAWARGGPMSENDLDFMVKPADAEAALEALVRAGMRAERPPEDWLFKAFNDEVMVDLIFKPTGMDVDDAVLARADSISVLAISTPVMALEDVLTTKLMALGEHALDYRSLLGITRALREQIDWAELHQRTAGSPYARAFFTLTEALGISAPPSAHAEPQRVRVVGTPQQ